MAEPNAKYPKIHEEYDLDLFQKEAVNIAKIAGKVCNSACNVPSVGLLSQYGNINTMMQRSRQLVTSSTIRETLSRSNKLSINTRVLLSPFPDCS